MGGSAATNPPPLPLSVEIPADRSVDPPYRSLPARPGVFAFESGDGRTAALAITANLRRLVRDRLSPPPLAEGRPNRRIDYRAVTRHVRAVTVGSTFEAEWVYIALARARLESTYRALLDRWQAWFVHVDPDAPFPRLVKTARPFEPPCGRDGVYLGPIPDKHAAQRYLEALQGIFDLCRYHHILVEAPHATACAYKELGRCPAPCDGTITMDDYRAMIRDAVDFAAQPYESWRDDMTESMQRAADALEFERAQAIRRRLDDAAPLTKPAFRFVDRLERCRFVAVMPSEHPGHVRLFVIRGGWIEPYADLPADVDGAAVDEVAAALDGALRRRYDEPAVDLLGLLARHLFPARRSQREGAFLPCGHGVDHAALSDAIRKVGRSGSPDAALPDTFLDVGSSA